MEADDPDELVRAVGQRIAELRRASGFSQEELAERLGTSVQWISRVEAGENLTLHSMVKLASVFGLKAVDLFTPPGPAPRPGRGRPRKK